MSQFNTNNNSQVRDSQIVNSSRDNIIPEEKQPSYDEKTEALIDSFSKISKSDFKKALASRRKSQQLSTGQSGIIPPNVYNAFPTEFQNLGYEPLNKHDVGLIKGVDQNEVRAANQSDWAAFGNGVANIIPQVLGDIVYGVGSLGEIPELFTKGYSDFDNALMSLGEQIRESNLLGEVYASKRAQSGFRLFDGEWWALNIGSIASAISLAIPAVGTIKALSALGSLARFGKLSKGFRITNLTKQLGKSLHASKIRNNAISGFSQGLVSRHMEMMMEGKETFDEIYQLGIERGLDEETAKAKAGEAAMAHYGLGYIAMLTDGPQYMMGLMGRKMKNVSGKTWKGLLGNMISEGGEEIFQYILGEEARRYGHDPDNYRLGNMPLNKYIKDPAMWTSGFFGALGGGLFYGGVDGVRGKISKFGQSVKKILTSDDPEAEAGENVIRDGVKNKDQDDLGNTLKSLNEDAKNMNPEDVSENNLDILLDALEASKESNNENPNGPNSSQVGLLRGIKNFYGNLIKKANKRIKTLFDPEIGSQEAIDYNLGKKRLNSLRAKLASPNITPYEKRAIQELINEEQDKINKIEALENFDPENYKVNEASSTWDEMKNENNDIVKRSIRERVSHLEGIDLKNGKISEDYLKSKEMQYNRLLEASTNQEAYNTIIDEINSQLENPSFSADANEDQKARDFYQRMKEKAQSQIKAKIANDISAVSMKDYEDSNFQEYMNDIFSQRFSSTLNKETKREIEASEAKKWDKMFPKNKTDIRQKLKYGIGKIFKGADGKEYIIDNIEIRNDKAYYIVNNKGIESNILEKEISRIEMGYDIPSTPASQQSSTKRNTTASLDTFFHDQGISPKGLKEDPPPTEDEDDKLIEQYNNLPKEYSNLSAKALKDKIEKNKKELDNVLKELKKLSAKGKSASMDDLWIAFFDFYNRNREILDNNPVLKQKLNSIVNAFEKGKSFKDIQKEIEEKFGIKLKLSEIQKFYDSKIAPTQTQESNRRKKRKIKQSKLKYDTDYSLDEIKEVFDILNKDSLLNNLFNRVLQAINGFSNIKVVFASPTNLNVSFKLGQAGVFDFNAGKIYINIEALMTSGEVAKALTHELIHGGLNHLFELYKTNPSKLTTEQKEIIDDLNLLTLALVSDPNFQFEYAITNPTELLAALSDKRFVDKLKRKRIDNKTTFLGKIIEFFSRLLGISTTYYDLVNEGFERLLDSTTPQTLMDAQLEASKKPKEEEEDDDDDTKGDSKEKLKILQQKKKDLELKKEMLEIVEEENKNLEEEYKKIPREKLAEEIGELNKKLQETIENRLKKLLKERFKEEKDTGSDKTDLETKIKDIERRRQEKLKGNIVEEVLLYKQTVRGKEFEVYEEKYDKNSDEFIRFVKREDGRITSTTKEEETIFDKETTKKEFIKDVTEDWIDIELQAEINNESDAEYVDAVEKGEMTKEQAMQALEKAGRKDSDAYATLKGESKEEDPTVPDKFKPGDKVKLLTGVNKGQIATVIGKAPKSNNRYKVKLEKGNTRIFAADNLEYQPSASSTNEIEVEVFEFENKKYYKDADNNIYPYTASEKLEEPIGKYNSEKDRIELNDGTFIEKTDPGSEKEVKDNAKPLFEFLNKSAVKLNNGEEVSLIDGLIDFDKSDLLGLKDKSDKESVIKISEELKKANLLGDVILQFLDSFANLNPNVASKIEREVFLKEFANYLKIISGRGELIVESMDVSDPVTEGGESIFTLDGYAKPSVSSGVTSTYEIDRNPSTGEPKGPADYFDRGYEKLDYDINFQFIREMFKFGNPFNFTIKFKLPTRLYSTLEATSAEDLDVFVVAVDGSGKEHIFATLKSDKNNPDAYPQAKKIREELFEKLEKAKKEDTVPKDFIEASGTSKITQIRPGRVNDIKPTPQNPNTRPRVKTSEIWDHNGVKGFAVAIPHRNDPKKFQLIHSNLEGYNGEEVVINNIIESDYLSKTEANFFILAQDTSGRYRWVRVHEQNVEDNKEVKEEINSILNEVKGYSQNLVKEGITRASQLRISENNPTVNSWIFSIDDISSRLQSLVRFRKKTDQGAYVYEPEINEKVIFVKKYLDENGIFSPEKFIKENKLYSRPCQIDADLLESNSSYVEVAVNRTESDLVRGNKFVYPAFRLGEYTVAEEASDKPVDSSPTATTSSDNISLNDVDPFDSLGFSTFTGEYSTLDVEQAKKDLKSLLGDFPLEIVDGLIDVGSFRAYGIAKSALIRLSRFASNKTLFHEAFHIVFRGILTAENRASILNEARERYSLTEEDIATATNIYNKLNEKYKNLPESTIEEIALEEKMAEEFAEYRITDTGVKGLLKKFFRVLKNFIKKLTGNWGKIDDLFRKINRGDYKEGVRLRNFDDAFSQFELTNEQIDQSVNTGLALLDHAIRKQYNENTDYLNEVYANALNSRNIDEDIILSTKKPNTVINIMVAHGLRNNIDPQTKFNLLSVVRALRPDIIDFDKITDANGNTSISYTYAESTPSPKIGPLYQEFLKGLSARGYAIKLDGTQLEKQDFRNGLEIDDIAIEETSTDFWTNNDAKISPRTSAGYAIRRVLGLLPKGEIGFHGMVLFHDPNKLYPELQRLIADSKSEYDMMEKLKKHHIFSELWKKLSHWEEATSAKTVEEKRRLGLYHKIVNDLWKIAQRTNSDHRALIYKRNSDGDLEAIFIKANRYTLESLIMDSLETHYKNKEDEATIDNLEMAKDVREKLNAPENKSKKDLIISKWNVVKNNLKDIKENPDPIRNRNIIAETKRYQREIAKYLMEFTIQDFQDSTFTVDGEKIWEYSVSGFIRRFFAEYNADPTQVTNFYLRDPLYENLPIWGQLPSMSLITNEGIKYLGESKGVGYNNFTVADHWNLMLNSWFNGNDPNRGYISMPVYSDSPVNESMSVIKLNDSEAIRAILAVRQFETDRINQEVSSKSSANFQKNKNARHLVPEELGENAESIRKWATETALKLAGQINTNDAIKRNLDHRMFKDKAGIRNKDALVRNLINFILNHIAYQSQMILLSAGDPSFYKSDANYSVLSDLFKRIKQLRSPVTYGSSNTVWVDKDGNLNKVPTTMKISVLPDIEIEAPQLKQLEEILGDVEAKPYEKSSLTDGTTFVTPHSYRWRKISLQEWSDAKEIMWKMLISGKIPNKKEIRKVIKELPEDSPISKELVKLRSFETIKPYVYTMIMTNILTDENVSKATPFQKKDSEVIIFPFHGFKTINGKKNPVYNPFYRSLLEKIGYVFDDTNQSVNTDNVNTEVDEGVFTFDSTLKVFIPKTNLPADFNLEENIDDYLENYVPSVEIPFDRWGKQQETTQHYYDTSELFGTQIMKHLIAELKGEHPDYQRIIAEYQQIIVNNVRNSYKALQKDVTDWPSLMARLKQDALNKSLGSEFLSLFNEKGDLTVPLWEPRLHKAISSLITSMYRNDVTKQKFASGFSLVNKSAVGFAKKPKIVFKDEKGNIIKEGDTTSKPHSIAHIEAIAPVLNSEMASYINEDGFIDEESFARMPDRLKELVAYRIPTEYKYSIFKIKIVAIDPFADTIVLPHEITTIAGLDFDIDKVKGFMKPSPKNYFQIASRFPEGREIMEKYKEQTEEIYEQIFGTKTLITDAQKYLIEKIVEIDNDLSEGEEFDSDEVKNVSFNKIQELLDSPEYKNLKTDIKDLQYFVSILYNKLRKLKKQRNRELSSVEKIKKAFEAFKIRNANESKLFNLIWNDILGHPSQAKKQLSPGGFEYLKRKAEEMIEKRIAEGDPEFGKDSFISDPSTTVRMSQRMNQGKALVGVAANYVAANAIFQNHDVFLEKSIRAIIINDKYAQALKDNTLINIEALSEIEYFKENPEAFEVLNDFVEKNMSSLSVALIQMFEAYNEEISTENLKKVRDKFLSKDTTLNLNVKTISLFEVANGLFSLFYFNQKTNTPDLKSVITSAIPAYTFDKNNNPTNRFREYNSVSERLDMLGDSKLRGMANFLAAFVDNGKFPIAEYINIHPEVVDIPFGLLSLGFTPDQTISILNTKKFVDLLREAVNSKRRISRALEKNSSSNLGEIPALTFNSKGEVLSSDQEVVDFLATFLPISDAISKLVEKTKLADKGSGPNFGNVLYSMRTFYKDVPFFNRSSVNKMLYNKEGFYLNALFEYGIEKFIIDINIKRDNVRTMSYPNLNGNNFNLILDIFQDQKGDFPLTNEEYELIYLQFLEYLSSPLYNESDHLERVEFFKQQLIDLKSERPENLFLKYINISNEGFIYFKGGTNLDQVDIQNVKKDAEKLPSNLLNFLEVYSYFSSGYRFDPNGFSHLLPEKAWSSPAKYEFLESQFEIFNTGESHAKFFFDQYIRNNFVNSKLVPKIPSKKLSIEIGGSQQWFYTFIDPERRYNPSKQPYLKTYKNGMNILLKYNESVGKWQQVPALATYEGSIKRGQLYSFGHKILDKKDQTYELKEIERPSSAALELLGKGFLGEEDDGPDTELSEESQKTIQFFRETVAEESMKFHISLDEGYYEDGSGNKWVRNTHFRDKPLLEKQDTPVDLETDNAVDQRMADYSNAIIASKDNPYTDKFGGSPSKFKGDEKIMISVKNNEDIDDIKEKIDNIFNTGGKNNSLQNLVFVFKTTNAANNVEKKIIDYLISKGVRYYEQDGLGMYIPKFKNPYGEFATKNGTKFDLFLRGFFEGVFDEDITQLEKEIEFLFYTGNITKKGLEILRKINNYYNKDFQRKGFEEGLVEQGNEEVLLDLLLTGNFNLYTFKKSLSELGFTPIALDLVFTDDYNNIGTTTDIIFVGRNNEVYVADFKTMRGNKFLERYGADSVSKYDSIAYDPADPSKGENQFSTRQKHQHQLATIRIALFNKYGIKAEPKGYTINLAFNSYGPSDTHPSTVELVSPEGGVANKIPWVVHDLKDTIENRAGDKISINNKVKKKAPSPKDTGEGTEEDEGEIAFTFGADNTAPKALYSTIINGKAFVLYENPDGSYELKNTTGEPISRIDKNLFLINWAEANHTEANPLYIDFELKGQRYMIIKSPLTSENVVEAYNTKNGQKITFDEDNMDFLSDDIVKAYLKFCNL